MSTTQRRRRSLLAAPVALLLATPLVGAQVGSAASLQVSAAPLQTWVLTELELPELPTLGRCGPLDQYDEIVYGTSGDDVLTPAKSTGNRRQVLVGLEGNDRLQAGNHGDCLVGGRGDDVLLGGNGRDILVGGLGADRLDGGTGKDAYYAGAEPGDTCEVKGAPDEPLDGCDNLTVTEFEPDPQEQPEQPEQPGPPADPKPGKDDTPQGGGTGNDEGGKGKPAKDGEVAGQPPTPSDVATEAGAEDATSDGSSKDAIVDGETAVPPAG